MTSLIVLARVLVAVGQALQEGEPDQLQPAQGAKARKAAKHKAAPQATPQATPPSADMSWEDLVWWSPARSPKPQGQRNC